ncbi:FUSC family protein [Nocardioides limicola]|uniref:FUSC family protein n=1 Tax=Nocardioides limicola TaxID=2803368 RepID=UPI00193B5140|nr:FUSC family protein [Nocardioides sp. DJM-14]
MTWLVPPGAMLQRSVLVVTPLLAGIGAVGLVGGRAAAAAAMVGVATIALSQGPLHRRSVGIAAMLPAAPAVAASVGFTEAPALLAAATLVGGGLVFAVAQLLRVSAPAEPIPAARAWRHAAVAATAAGAATWLVTARDIPHGYWMTIAILAVLRPARAETTRNARDRAVGTVVRVGIAIAVVLLAPAPLVLVAAIAGLLGTVAWALAGDTMRMVALLTPTVILVGSSGVSGVAVELAVERLLLTGIGVLLASALAVLLARSEARTTTVDQ